MNFLAHLYLSGNNPGIKTGNFIADYVKGSKYDHFPEDIQKGIQMHRFIDHFTDTHALVRSGIAPLRPVYGKYAGVVMDIFFDHLLAIQWDKYSNQPLTEFVDEAHAAILHNLKYLPFDLKLFIPHFILFQRLKSYQHLSGIQVVLHKMAVRFNMPDRGDEGVEILVSRYNTYHEEFNAFFPELCYHVHEKFGIIVKNIKQ